jgi:hypothetical protein
VINNVSFFNFSMIDECDAGWAIRKVLEELMQDESVF